MAKPRAIVSHDVWSGLINCLSDWHKGWQMYQNDSFFSLGGGGQVGLAALSLVLTVLVVLGAARLMRGRSIDARLGIAVLVFALFVWLSPQVYYAYYWLIFEDLPVQWVISWPPLKAAWHYASFTGPSNLSAHGQGVLFWVLVLCALMGLKRRGPKP